MSSPFAYRRSCVPVAVAELLDWSPEAAAELLWRAGCARPTRLWWATDLTETSDALLRLGIGSELWSPQGVLLISATEHETSLSCRRHVAALRVRPSRASSPGPAETVPTMVETDALTLSAWRDRFHAGRWLLTIPHPTGCTHAVALRDGMLTLAEGLESRRVLHALHLLPRSAP